jgi:hypothetical protein
MSRRILLIDADTEFRDTLTQHLGRYRVVVITEADPDRALASAASEAPDLLVIAVEEPDKQGFKTFQKARKGVAAKLPIVLVTKSLSADSFAKHRSLKFHADEYIDQRGLTKDELVGKLDNLIGLGDLDEDVSIPVEDEIPMEIADGDVVLDEQLEEDAAAEFANEHDLATVGGNNTVLVDQMVSAETDAAFDALLGDDMLASSPVPLPGVAPVPEHVERTSAGAIEAPVGPASSEPGDDEEPTRAPTPEPVAEPEPMEARDMTGIPEPVPHKIADDEEPVPQAAHDWDEQSIPERVINDGGRPTGGYEALADDLVEHLPRVEVPEVPLGAEGPNAASRADDEQPQDESLARAAADDDDPIAPVEVETSIDEESGHEVSLSSIPIVDDDLVSLDDDAIDEVQEVQETQVEQSAPAATAPAQDAASVEPASAEPAANASPPVGEARPPAASEHARAKRATGSQASIDLGLDKLARDAESEQSGVYDRKSLRKIGELERQVAQLKNELDRARVQADQAAKGQSRESQFLNLREANLAKDKEIKATRAQLEQQSKELAEAQEKLRQVAHAKSALEAKNSELEEKLFEDGGKVKELAASLKAATAQASQLEQELDVASKARTKAAAALAQAEKDLAAERASGAASASEAERKLRGERDQMLVRHKGELAALRAEAEAAHELAAQRLRDELEVEKTAAVREAVEALQRSLEAEHDEALLRIETEHGAELVKIKSEHAGELSRVKNELTADIERLKLAVSEAEQSRAAAEEARDAAIAAARQERDLAIIAAHRERDAAIVAADREREAAVDAANEERDTAIAAANDERDTAIAAARHQRDAAVAAANRERETAIASVQEESALALANAQEQHEAALAAAQHDHAAALSSAERKHAKERDALRAQHAKEIQTRDAAHAEVRDQDAQAHAEAIAQLQQQLERETAAWEVKLSTARREFDDQVTQLQRERAELAQTHELALGELRAQHAGELEKAAEAARRAAEAQRAAMTEQQATYEAQIAELQQNAARELAEVRANAAREIAEKRALIQAANQAMQDGLARFEAEREEAARAHAAAITDLETKHDRALAIAKGEYAKAKAAAGAEHEQAIAQLKAEADRMLKQLEEDRTRAIRELESERQELMKGLSGARDSLERSEHELASAVQTIADRNADLRAHAAAIAERDQRITELRADLESLEQENASYQEQVLRAYQKIKSDEAMVARARKAMAIALTVLDDEGNPTSSSGSTS